MRKYTCTQTHTALVIVWARLAGAKDVYLTRKGVQCEKAPGRLEGRRVVPADQH